MLAIAVVTGLFWILEWRRFKIFLRMPETNAGFIIPTIFSFVMRRCKPCQFVQRINLQKQEEIEVRANWKMSAPNLVKCSKCGELMMPHRVCKACGSYNKKEIIAMD